MEVKLTENEPKRTIRFHLAQLIKIAVMPMNKRFKAVFSML